MKKVFCFGELLLRMSPRLDREWISKSQIPVFIGGAELNTATALANWNIPAKYITALPSNYLSEEIIEEIKNRKIDTSGIHLSGDRIGIYYLPQGTDLKNAAVIYDRAHSSFSSLKPGMIDWDKALEDCSWFHFSAISPALNENIVEVCKEGLQAAKAKGLKISLDLNYRAKLWQYGTDPHHVMPQLAAYCDVIMGNIWAAEKLLGIPSPIQDSKGKTQNELVEAAGMSMKAIHLAFPQVQTMAFTFRLDETYFAVLQHGHEMKISKEFPLLNIQDKVGSGDCFMGGLIYGLYQQHDPQSIIDFASAAAVGKMSETGDATKQTIGSIKEILNQVWTKTNH